MKYNPDLARIVNEQVELEEKLAQARGKNKKEEKHEEQTPITETEISNLNDWVLLPARTHKENNLEYSYPDTLICSYRLRNEDLSNELKQYGNTAKDSLNRGFIGNIDWQTAIKLVLKSGLNPIPQRQFIDFLDLLYKGFNEKSFKVYNGKGDILDSRICQQIFNDITEVKNPLRYEHLDADYKFENNKLYVEYNHKLDRNGNLISRKDQLTNWLDKDKTPGIDLVSLFKTANIHGLPTEKTQKGDLYYWCPDKDNNSVS